MFPSSLFLSLFFLSLSLFFFSLISLSIYLSLFLSFIFFSLSLSPLALPLSLRSPFRFLLSCIPSFSLLLSFILSLHSLTLCLCLVVWYRESFGTKRKHFDFQRDGGGVATGVEGTDKENSLTTLMSTTARPGRIYTHRY